MEALSKFFAKAAHVIKVVAEPQHEELPPVQIPEIEETVFFPVWSNYSDIFGVEFADHASLCPIAGNLYLYISCLTDSKYVNQASFTLSQPLIDAVNLKNKPFLFSLRTGETRTLYACKSTNIRPLLSVLYFSAAVKHYRYARQMYYSAFRVPNEPPSRQALDTAMAQMHRCLWLLAQFTAQSASTQIYLQDIVLKEAIDLMRGLTILTIHIITYFTSLAQNKLPVCLSNAICTIKSLVPTADIEIDKKEMANCVITLISCWCDETLEDGTVASLTPPFQCVTKEMVGIFLTRVHRFGACTQIDATQTDPLINAINTFTKTFGTSITTPSIVTRQSTTETANATSFIKTIRFSPRTECDNDDYDDDGNNTTRDGQAGDND